MVTIVIRRSQGKLMEAFVTDDGPMMYRSIFPTCGGMVEQSFTYLSKDEAHRHWCALADELRDDSRREFISCSIGYWDDPTRRELILQQDMAHPDDPVESGTIEM